MQPRVASMLAIAGLFAVLDCSVALAVSAKSETRALSWLRARGGGVPQADELAELKSENPEAYGLVKALLMKRSLGLLDPKHPTASFAAAKSAPAEDVPGAEGFEKIAEESGDKPKVAPLYPDAPATVAHHNWLDWKPQQGAMDDEAVVSNVLGTVAQLKGGGQGHQASEAGTGSGGDELKWSSPSADAPVSAQASPSDAPSASAAPAAASSENPYLKGLDLGDLAVASQAAPVHPPSIVAFSDASSQSTEKAPEKSSESLLSSFSWDDREVAKPQAGTPSVDQKPKSALLRWLGML